jgi:tetratricopeptide (TPR) repeat protein
MGGMNIGDVTSGRDVFIGSNVTQTIYEAPTPTIQSLHQLRAPVADFVGRQAEINRLVQALSEEANISEGAIGGIRGLGGIGKTQLALAVAQRLVDTFPDAQLLIEMRGVSDHSLTPEQILQTVIRAFEPLAPLPDNFDALQSTYLTLLNGKRVLILADDARDVRQVEPLLPPSRCALLLTSRQRFTLPGMETLDMEVLPLLEAEKLLLEICPRIGSAATRMAELCARLPLALRLCAGICANSTMSIEFQIEALEAETRLAYMRDRNDPKRSVEASLQLSYSALDPQAQQALCQLSVFPAGFDMLAAKAVVHVANGQAEGAESQGTNANELPMEELLDLLYGQSLIEWNKQTGRYSLHEPVRVFGLARMKGEEAVRLRHAQYYVLIAASAYNLYEKGGEDLLLGLKLFDGERANIDAGWNWARKQAEEQAENTAKKIDKLLLEYANATVYAGGLRYDKRRERIPQLEAALGAARRLSNRGAESMALGNLGAAYYNLGEMDKAIHYYEQSLEIDRALEDRQGEGLVLGGLGLAYMHLGETDKAIQYFEQHLQIAREIRDRKGEGDALGNLGLAYWNLGEPHKAIQYFEQRLQIAQEMRDQWSKSIAMGSLGIAYADLGETDKAIYHYEQRLEISRGISDHQGEAITSWNLGALLAEEGDVARAVELMQVMVDYERQIGHTNAEEHAATLEELRERLA